MRFATLSAALLAISASPALAQDVSNEPAKPGFASAVYGYTCAGGASLDIAYINVDGGLSLAVVHIDGDLLVMKNVASASGARYETTDGDERFVWWAKGNDGFLKKGPDGEEEFVYKACQG